MTTPANWSHFTFITKNLQWPLNIVKFQLDCLRISVFLPLQNGSFASQIHKALPHVWLRSLPSCPWRVRQQSYGDWLASRSHSNCPSLYSTSDFTAIMLEELTLLPWCKASPARCPWSQLLQGLELSRGSRLRSNVPLSENLPSSPKLNTQSLSSVPF